MSEDQTPFIFGAPIPTTPRSEAPSRSAYGLHCKVDFSADQIALQITWHDGHGGQNAFTREVIFLKDRAIRDALIRLGWTPPNE